MAQQSKTMPPTSDYDGAIAASILNSVTNKERHYIDVLRKYCQSNLTSLSGHLQRMRADIASLWEDDPEMKSEFQSFMEEQTPFVQEMSASTVRRQFHVKHFVQAVRELQEQSSTGEASPAEIAATLDTLLQQQKSSNGGESENLLQQDEFYRQVMEALGKETSANDDEDDDIHYVAAAIPSSSASLKCPITAVLMEDPVQNPICGHTYSLAGIRQHLSNAGNRACRCPVAGCMNRTAIVEDKLTKNYAVEQAVRREKRRVQQEFQRIASQANDLEEDDGSFSDGDEIFVTNGTTTVKKE